LKASDRHFVYNKTSVINNFDIYFSNFSRLTLQFFPKFLF